MTTGPICKLLRKKGAVQELCGLENTPKAQGQTSQLDDTGVRLLYRRYEAKDACVVPHNRRLLVRLQCHNHVQRITSLGWELHLAKYLTKPAKSLTVPITISLDASGVERLLKLRSLGRIENGMMLLVPHQCPGSREVVWIPTDPWPKLGQLKRRKHLPDEDTSTNVWYLDRCDQYLERPIAAIPIKYPDYYRYYRRTQGERGSTNAIASNPAKDFVYDCPSSKSDDAVSRDHFQANVRPDEGEQP